MLGVVWMFPFFSLSPSLPLPPACHHLQSRIQAQPDKGMLHGPCLWCICVGMMGGCASDGRTRSAQLVFVTVIIFLHVTTCVTIVDLFSLFISFSHLVSSRSVGHERQTVPQRYRDLLVGGHHLCPVSLLSRWQDKVSPSCLYSWYNWALWGKHTHTHTSFVNLLMYEHVWGTFTCCKLLIIVMTLSICIFRNS